MAEQRTIDRAVVIGASMAGLLAARVLADHSRQVTILERDRLPEGADHRPGVPQARHGHGLLARGLQIMEALFPGLHDDLDAAGVPRVEWMHDTLQRIPTGWTPRYHSGLIARSCTRVTLEAVVRKRVLALPNVRVIESAYVEALTADAQARRITGVTFSRQRRNDASSTTLQADLIVDASGRGSRAPEWLAALGYRPPAETIIDAKLGYASRLYRLRSEPEWKTLLLMTSPALPRGGAFHAVEGDRWILTLAGIGDHRPPTDEAGLNAFIASLGVPLLSEALADAEPLTPIYGYSRTANRLRHYERLRHPPDGFITLGDAVCAFNPIYGQGMSASAIAAGTLDHALRRGLRGLPRRFQRALARANADIWLMATTEDLRYPATTGRRWSPMRMLQTAYIDLLFRAAPASPAVTQALLETMHLLRRPYGLLRPAVLLPAVGALLRRRPAQHVPSGAPAALPSRDAIASP
jgi:2-polyprenyl-6-methoxyphenol hydroxylase-like FAD-dependent oxidoreductase